MMTNVMLVGIGGFLGAIARFSISQWLNQRFVSHFPYGTLAVNLIGSFAAGLLFGWGLTEGSWYLLSGVGFMGAFTTFSTFHVEILELSKQQAKKVLMYYVGVGYIGGICLAFLGLILVMK